MVAELGGGKIGDGGQKVQTSSYKINPGDVMYSMVYNKVLLTVVS